MFDVKGDSKGAFFFLDVCRTRQTPGNDLTEAPAEAVQADEMSIGIVSMAGNGLVKMIYLSTRNLVRFVYFKGYQRRSSTAIR